MLGEDAKDRSFLSTCDSESKQLVEKDADRRQARTGKWGIAFHDETVEVGSGLGAAMDFDAALDREDDPVFLHARLGVERGFFAIEASAADGDLDDQGRRRGMAGSVILTRNQARPRCRVRVRSRAR